MATEIIERNDIFDLAFRFITETSENIFLTGKAGTGKTTFLKYLKNNCTKNIVVAAPTGVAAINAGGVTLHSLFQLPFYPFLPTKGNRDELLGKIKYTRQRQQLLLKVELLVIDEISMVRCDVIDAIDAILRSVRRTYDIPFGGVQVLCIGDLYQLPPVAQNHEWSVLQEYYASPFFFDSLAIREQMPLLIELNKIYRQKEDSFVSLLNKVRNNNMSSDDFEDLHLRYNPGFIPDPEEKYITLSSHNKQADQINLQAINRLLAASFTYHAIIENDFAENLYPVEAALVLKEGAQVMFLKNDNVLKRYYNGKIGVVKKLENERVIVECDGMEIDVAPETWDNARYVINRVDGKLEQEILGTFSQYPLRLAWAITIHKSQGLTFDKVMIDAGSAFSSGQVYVALSRCTRLEGIILLSKIPASAIYSNDNVVKGQQSLTHRGSLAERFQGARLVYTEQLLENLFGFAEVISSVDMLAYHIRQHADRLDYSATEWIQQLKEKVTADKKVGARFGVEVTLHLKTIPEIENNPVLQQRITSAANYFISKFNGYLKEFKQLPFVTEHKETSTIINEFLSNAFLSIYTAHYHLCYCIEPFSVTGYLQHKLKFVLPTNRISIYASGKKQAAVDSINQELFDTLKRWRDMVCEETGLPIYMIANKETLLEISTYLPLSKKHLLQISGFGKAKVDKYGADVLDAVQEYCSRFDLETNIAAKAATPYRESKIKNKVAGNADKKETKKQSFDLYKTGKSITDIALERNLATGTIENHLSYFVGSGELNLSEFVKDDIQCLIVNAINIHGRVSSKTLKENLPDTVSFSDIKMVLASHTS